MNVKRDYQDELIRVIAMFFVIILHLSNDIPIKNFVTVIVFCCNTLFFMLSGKYNLRFHSEGRDIKDYILFYKKRFISIFIPFFIYSILYYIYINLHTNDTIFQSIKMFLINFIEGKICSVYWYMYCLIGLLLSTPFLAKLVNNLSTKELQLMIAIAIIWQFISATIVQGIFKHNFYFRMWFLTPWILQFVLGYVINRVIKTKKHINICLFVGIVGFIVILCRVVFFEPSVTDLYGQTPFYILYSIGMYLFLERIVVIKNKVTLSVITFLAKYSFSIYLTHVFVLKLLNQYNIFLKIYPNINVYVLWILNIIMTVCLSLLGAIVMDNIIINPIKEMLTRFLINTNGR